MAFPSMCTVHAASVRIAQRTGFERTSIRLWSGAMRGLYRAHRREGHALMRLPGRQRRQREDYNPRRPRELGASASVAAGFHRRAGGPVRLLHQRHDHAGKGLAGCKPAPDRRRDQGRAGGQSLPLRNAYPDRARCEACRANRIKETTMQNPILSRRDFLKAGGSLVVAFSFGPLLHKTAMADAATGKALSLDQVDSFLSIGADGTVTCYSGKVDLGTGVRTALTQIVADELTVALEKVELITGDTLLTPVVRPAAIGARLLGVDEDSVKAIPDIVKVVREGNFLAVVARSEWGAIKGARALKATWSEWSGLPDESRLWEHVRSTKVVKEDVTSDVGHTEQVLPQAATHLSATYDFAIHTHGSIGPSCAVAEFRDGKLTSWSASQATHNLRKQLAAMFSLPEENVRAIYVEGAGCYGRNGHEDAAADAALLARAMGKPVRVQWMRADEHGWDPKGPPTLVDMRAGLDAAGKVMAWHSQFYIPQGVAGPVALVAAELDALPHETDIRPVNNLNDSALPYDFPNMLTVGHRPGDTPPPP